MGGNNKFIDKFSNVAMRVGGQIHLKALRDTFATIMPLYILAGLAVLVNNVVLPFILKGAALENAQYWGTVITNGTLNISGLLVAPIVAYMLSQSRRFENPLAAALIALSSLVVMMPNVLEVTPLNAEKAVATTGVLGYSNIGTTGLFAGIIIGLITAELFINISSIDKLKIKLGDNIPLAVSNSFNVLIPVILVLAFWGIISTILYVSFDTNLVALISQFIQEPLRKVNTSLVGVLFLYSLGNFLFTLGIHQTVIYGTLLEPLLIANINENMLAYANHQAIPNIMNVAFVPTFGMIGGSGSTIVLIIVTLLFSKNKVSKSIAKLGLAPGIFNINEPIIFGYPIVYNIALMIPFVLLPAIGIAVAYAATAIGFMNPCVVYIPWTTPPLVNAYLATAGDWRAVIVQLLIIIIGVLLYLPFVKINDKIVEKQMTEGEAEEA
ncbi:MAG TPA: PTS transporter subunit EIIC [Candidatus Anaerostipes excrementavium]|uniref:Permease IIC component n=1 Tax=Candidatus Anaerostipes excrementavium TaxID=2838463 RepID=A0A9D2B8D2_9FIRM|nr:PTS transporter subunit EIIC [uncultured Anaerostipes sp.]HIX66821.1 PTS transporter subunit EIIC [Candidatus Anaerostipes excrementavium]